MLFISCVMLFVSQFKRCASYDVSAEEKKLTLNLPFKTRSCPVALRSLLFVSTVDGKLTCINARNGQPLWIFDLNESLLSSSISHIKVRSDLRKTHFIPSLDGNLYKWNGQYVESIPLSSDYLLGQLKKLPDGSFVIGGYSVVVYGIDMSTGKILYECSGDGCTPTQKGKIDEKDIISLRKSRHTVRAVDRTTGHENWNYSVGKYEMELAQQDYISTISKSDIDLHFSVQNGVIYNKEESSVWSLKLNSPIADAWQLENRSLKPVDIFKYGLLEGEGLDSLPGGDQTFMFLGVHEGQLYIQKPLDIHRKRKHVLDRTPQLDVDLSHWRPFISTPSRTPTLNNNKQQTSLSILDYPFDNGFVLIANTTPTAMSILPDNSNPNDEDDSGVCDNNENGNTRDFKTVSETPEKLEAVPLSPIDRWKEILILSILLAVCINIGVKMLKRKFATKTQLPNTSSSDTTLKPEEMQFKDETISEVKPKWNKTNSGNKSDLSMKVTIDLSSSEAYTSRYMEDFEHLECLGKGGFGVVFKATKKIDDIEYAIKRIYLPRCEEAKSKMMREVKALAALDHPGIVRYFHAWWEEPPQDWQLATDKTFLMKDYHHETSYALSQDWMLQVSVSGHSRNSSEKRKPEKKIADDPLGKRFNFITGIEDIITDHSEFDLLKHNDVFYPDDESSSFVDIDINKDFNEDSSGIEFDSDCTSDIINNTPGIGRKKSLTVEELSVNKELNEELNEDSFDIVFASNCSSDNPSEPCHQTSMSNYTDTDTSRKKTLTQQDELEIFAKESDQIKNSEISPRRKRKRQRLVGKCCAQNSSCLTEPPLFLYIQMQLCRQETLKDWLKTKADEGIQLVESMQIFMQIVDAVEYFHNLGLMHRDLKPANIFFSLDGSVKVGDFGLVTAITRPSVGKHHHGKSFEDENHTGQVGTQLYMSPEQGTGKPYSHKVDIYSVGLIFFELICAFSTQMERMKDIYKLKQGVLADDLLNTPQGKLVQILTATDPDMRPEAKEIKEHNFITEINNNMCSDSDKVANTVDSDLSGLTSISS